jgi:CheY-like chemotaxis protein
MANKLKILVAEDDHNDRLLFTRALAAAGLAADTQFVEDGREVIDYLQGVPPFDNPSLHFFPNVLLLDLQLIRVDGFAVLEWLRTKPDLRLRLLVLAVTASPEPLHLKRANELGADVSICKADGFDQLVPMLRRLEGVLAKTAGPGSEIP